MFSDEIVKVEHLIKIITRHNCETMVLGKEQKEIVHFNVSDNMKKLFACVDCEINDLTPEKLFYDPTPLEEISQYDVFGMLNPGDGYRNAQPITGIEFDGRRLILFV